MISLSMSVGSPRAWILVVQAGSNTCERKREERKWAEKPEGLLHPVGPSGAKPACSETPLLGGEGPGTWTPTKLRAL